MNSGMCFRISRLYQIKKTFNFAILLMVFKCKKPMLCCKNVLANFLEGTKRAYDPDPEFLSVHSFSATILRKTFVPKLKCETLTESVKGRRVFLKFPKILF